MALDERLRIETVNLDRVDTFKGIAMSAMTP
jgi:hypothetical protein